MGERTFVDIEPAGSGALAVGWRCVMAELRTGLDDEAIGTGAAAQAAAEGYVATACVADGDVVAAAGWRVTTMLAFGRHVYVDDLVTASASRSAGHGAALLAHIEERARSLGLVGLRLDSGLHRVDAHRFYDREGWDRASWSFRKPLSD